jgi:hypothetical protein
MSLDAVTLLVGIVLGIIIGVGLITILAVTYGGGKE